jgi:two-component system sensor histidine kinase ChvG
MIAALLEQREARGLPNGNVRIEVRSPPEGVAEVLGEGARLERVFENLIENAVSFSPEGGLIAISAASDREMLTMVRVEDEGPGVPDEAREAIFRRFHSVRPRVKPLASIRG